METHIITRRWAGFGRGGRGKRGAPLTSREREVYLLIMAGESNKEIATALGISTRTVKFHAANLLGKCGAASRIELLTQQRK